MSLPPDAHVLRDTVPLPPPDQVIHVGVVHQADYPVLVTEGIDDAVKHLVTTVEACHRVALVTDETVADLYGESVVRALDRHGVEAIMLTMPPGEQSKTMHTAERLLDALAHSSMRRRDLLVALGGGVVIDTAGWVASAYMRGMPYANLPTTLLAAVDAAIGGKVAVDHPRAKNLIGAFYQPTAVVCATASLATLGGRHIRSGLAEAIKKGVIASPALFAMIEQELPSILGRQPDALSGLVHAAAAVKCRLIARDPYEADLRRPLNFGHTLGHAVETVTGYGPVLHGEAVAFGMACAARIAHARDWLPDHAFDRIMTLLGRAGLPCTGDQLAVTAAPDAVLAALESIRLIRDGRLRFVLPIDIGATAITDDVTDQEVRRALTA